jgi:tetratricopeptide (TPR) repeat protein
MIKDNLEQEFARVQGWPMAKFRPGRLLVAAIFGCLPHLCPGDTPTQAQPLQREAHTPEERLQFAEGLLNRKFYDMAAGELRHFLDQHPDHSLAPLAQFHLIECLRAQDKVAETMSNINRFQSRWPEHELAAKLFLWKGELLLKEAKFPQAQRCFQRLLLSTDSQTQEAAVYFLAQSYAREGRETLAVTTYRRIADKPLDNQHLYRPFALFAVALAAQNRGEFREAQNAYERLLASQNISPPLREETTYRLGETHFVREAYTKAIEHYESLLVDFPDGFFAREARKRRAWAFFLLGQYEKAIKLSGDWQDQYPNIFDYEILYVQSGAFLGAARWAEALPRLKKLAMAAEVPEAYRQLVRYQEVYCLLMMNQYPETISRAATFAEDYPKSASLADVHYFAAEAWYRSNDFTAAVKEYRRALNNLPGEWQYSLEASLRLADSLKKLSNYKAAAQTYRDLARQPYTDDRASMLLQAGECERRAGDSTASIADFERIVREFPEADQISRAAMLNLGELYAAANEYTKAEKLLSELLKRDSANGKGRLLFFLGYLHYLQGHHEQAAKHLKQAIAQSDNGRVRTDAKYFLTGALLELKQVEEAMAVFADVLKLPQDQRPQFSSDLLFRLEKLYYERGRYQVSENICHWLLGWKDETVVYKANLALAQILVASQRLDAAQTLLENLVAKREAQAKNKPDQDFSLEELSSLLGEVFFLKHDKDRAVRAFEKTLARPGVSMEYAIRARWGLAEIFSTEGRNRQALHYAVNAFVLGNEPVYTPRAMYLAVKLLLEDKRPKEAKTTWEELQTRFPSFAEAKRSDSVVKKLLAETAGG